MGGPGGVRDAWLDRATDPASIEYIVSLDGDDLDSVASTEGWNRVVNGAGSGQVTAVRNWNAAAAASTGELLFAIADDLRPPVGWDQALMECCCGLDPYRTAFAVKVRDSPDPADVKLRHPVVSRAFYGVHGLFSPVYRGLYCDDDLTARAFWKSFILDGRALVLEHRHPNLDPAIPVSASHEKMNRHEEFEHGRALYAAGWSKRQRLARRQLLPTAPGCRLNPFAVFIAARRLRLVSSAGYLIQRAHRALTLRVHGTQASQHAQNHGDSGR